MKKKRTFSLLSFLKMLFFSYREKKGKYSVSWSVSYKKRENMQAMLMAQPEGHGICDGLDLLC